MRLEASGPPVTEAEVAPPEWIVATTFRGSAMSHGSLHRVAHRAIAAAFNRLGSKSNSGEGGEDPRRDRGGEWALDRSRVRQIASGRFGVDARYLVNADDLEIKIGQGAKPGEGGHLPGHKVTAEIAFIRKTREGVSLISPPPHHDIYSIEDLAQLVYDLRQIHPRAGISVKCPTVTDIGTIAVGVVKAGADVVAISGSEGGTGAAAASSIEHAGLPLERGLAEVHQALVVNGIRQGVVLRVDGGIKTGDDVVKLLALGADEVSLGTALMIAEQCTFCHGCAKGNCPAGITTQSDEVAKRLMKLKGADAKKAAPQPVMALAAIQNPDDDEEMRYQDATAAVERYLLALAGDVRRTLARLGLKTPAELVGRVDLLRQAPTGSARTDTVDLSELLVDPKAFDGKRQPLARMAVSALPGDREAPSPANARILEVVAAGVAETEAGARIGPVEVDLGIHATDRAVGATLAGEIAAGRLAVPEHGIHLRLDGQRRPGPGLRPRRRRAPRPGGLRQRHGGRGHERRAHPGAPPGRRPPGRRAAHRLGGGQRRGLRDDRWHPLPRGALRPAPRGAHERGRHRLRGRREVRLRVHDRRGGGGPRLHRRPGLQRDDRRGRLPPRGGRVRRRG